MFSAHRARFCLRFGNHRANRPECRRFCDSTLLDQRLVEIGALLNHQWEFGEPKDMIGDVRGRARSAPRAAGLDETWRSGEGTTLNGPFTLKNFANVIDGANFARVCDHAGFSIPHESIGIDAGIHRARHT